jgi:hypothetical protein
MLFLSLNRPFPAFSPAFSCCFESQPAHSFSS